MFLLNRFVFFLVFVLINYTNCGATEEIFFTGLEPSRITIFPLKNGEAAGANYVYKYKEGERLNVSCVADDIDEVQDFKFFNSSSREVIQLNATFEFTAHLKSDGSSLFCSLLRNGSDYSILLVLETSRPEKLFFTGLQYDRVIDILKNGFFLAYEYLPGEFLDIGCGSETHIETKRFRFYNGSSRSIKHLFHARFKESADSAAIQSGSALECSYEDYNTRTNHVINLVFKRHVPETPKPSNTNRQQKLSPKEIAIIIFSFAGFLILFLVIDIKMAIELTSHLLQVCKSALKSMATLLIQSMAIPLAQLRDKMRRKRTKVTAEFHQWAKVVKVVISDENDTSIVPVISIEKVRYSEFSDILSEYILPVDTKWELPRERLSFGELLGEGEFGRVLRAEYRGGPHSRLPRTVAVKMLKEEHTDSDMIALVAEMEIMKTIGKHEHVVNLLGCCARGGPLGVVVEFADQGCLRDYLRRRDPKYVYRTMSRAPEGEGILTERDFVDFALQVAKGMEFLVSRGCIHRDLAARNVLVSGARTLKVADFGLARDLRDALYYRKRSSGKLPVRWMAPESLQRNYYTEHSDVWSFGVLFWEIASFGATPFRQLSVHILYDYLKSGQRLDKPDGCRDIIYALMLKCWTFQAEHRPHFSDLVINLQEMLNGYEEKLSIDTN